MKAPTLVDLYLAFRQAKTALFFERRGVGMIELAEYEEDLPRRLRLLRAKLSSDQWFDKLRIGRLCIVPKRLRGVDAPEDSTIRIGPATANADRQELEVQLRLAPSPEFAITEVLYLWKFGGILEAALSPVDVLGYRLDLRQGRIDPCRRWLFQYWPKSYQAFRTVPLEAARKELNCGRGVTIFSGDLAHYYDTVDPSFMAESAFLESIEFSGRGHFSKREYQVATASLLRAFARFRHIARRATGLPILSGVPIGALTSRVIANVALATLDSYVRKREGVLCYRRYVDDLVIVATASSDKLAATAARLLPLAHIQSTEELILDSARLDRAGSSFRLQMRKLKVHHLEGNQGSDFVEAVASGFEKSVSESREFIDPSTIASEGVSQLVRARRDGLSALRVLRDADRVRLERFALSTRLQSLERISSMIEPTEACTLVRRNLKEVGRVLDGEGDWVDDLEVSLRLLRLATFTADWRSVEELCVRMNRIWGSAGALKASTRRLYLGDREINRKGSAPWAALARYLHERRIETVASTIPLASKLGSPNWRKCRFLSARARLLGRGALQARGRLLASADLRARDREDDKVPATLTTKVADQWNIPELTRNRGLSRRFRTIDEFLSKCDALGDPAWKLPAVRLFLCTRPPSYFDIARRWLYRVETTGFDRRVFEKLLDVVNAVRGTCYVEAIGRVSDSATVEIGGACLADTRAPGRDPRVILGNLSVAERDWAAAASRTQSSPWSRPQLSSSRLQQLARVIARATQCSRRARDAVLVLPELSVPRPWFRALAHHVIRLGRFSLVAGLEYGHHPRRPEVMNQVFAVLPGPLRSAATWPWTKRLPAREEEEALSSLHPPLRFIRPPRSGNRRAVIQTPWGAISVLICSELIESRRVADLFGRVNLVLCPSWNRDTAAYDHLVRSVGMQLHAIVAIANNGRYSDCRAWAPRKARWEQDLCRLIERGVDDIVYVDVPLSSLARFRRSPSEQEWKPLPPGI